VIAVDTSALMAIMLNEPAAETCAAILAAETEVLISAGTLAEALIVAAHRNLSEEMSRLVLDLGFEIIPVTPTAAHRIAGAYRRWGKGVHPAGLNFGDCFAYETAKEHACPLLFIGNDFSKTDLAKIGT